jgi:predicted acetyltransferase
MGGVIDVKTLESDDLRAAHALFRAAVHHPPATDAGWQVASGSFLPGRTFGGYADGRLVGTTMSAPMRMTIPGGAMLASAAVTRVGVRADHTRRGVLTALMREQLASVAAAGEPIASLRASEYPIYGRFGYGVATRGRHITVDVPRAAYHPGARLSGQVRLIDRDEMLAVLPEVYRRITPGRPGRLERNQQWWRLNLEQPGREDELVVAAVHSGQDGDDGFMLYHPQKNATADNPWGTMLQIDDLHAANMPATAALWRFVLRVDLINQVKAWLRPLDEPLQLLLADPRAVVSQLDDEAWLRLVDVPAALSARSWAGSEAVLLAVRDPLLTANTGCYRITPDGVSRVDAAPQLECDVAVAGRLYLGDVAPSTLAATGWLTVHDQAALPAADSLFATAEVPWSGTFF